MKKTMYALAMLFMLICSVNTVSAKEQPSGTPTEMNAEQKAQFQRIKDRVEEIKAMDKSKLSSSERKALRKELKEMKNQARAMKGGIYLSVGAIIIIILVLILIL